MFSSFKAHAIRRGSISAALAGSAIGLALGATYLSAGMAQAIADHHRAVRIAESAGGGFSETMLQREMDRMDPAALRLARAHDALAVEAGADATSGWPARAGERAAPGRRPSALAGARDLDCLTEAVYFEARGETPRGQAAVAQVVMNRVANPSFPKTVCGVVFQGAATHGCQFSFACDGSMGHGLEAEAWDRARRIAERTLAGLAPDAVGGATHFHTLSVQPAWGPQMLRVAQVGLHVFYRFNPHAPMIAPVGPAANIRLAAAVLEKASSVTVTPASVAAQPASAVEARAAAKPVDLSASIKPQDAPAAQTPAES